MMTLETLRQRRDEILALAKRYGADNIRVFGSIVRGEAGEQSDVDILVHLEENRTLLDHVGLKLDLEELLGCEVDLVEDEGVYPRLRDRILAEAVVL